MPKIIPGLRTQILKTAKQQLVHNGGKIFSIRGIAAECGIAPGTIYNYYPDKTALLAAVMAEDWKASLNRLDRVCRTADNFPEGILGMRRIIEEFAAMYEHIWYVYRTHPDRTSEEKKRHEKLIAEIRQYTDCLYDRFVKEDRKITSRLVSECILTSVIHKEITDEEIKALCSYITEDQ